MFATGTIAVHEGLREVGDVDNAVATIEFTGGEIATIYASRTMAHGHETLTEIVGTGGRLTVGQKPRINRVELSDAHGVRNECTPTFYERFEDAFLLEAQAFVDVVRNDAAPPLTLARRDRGDAHRHRRHRIAALAQDGRALGSPGVAVRAARLTCAPERPRTPAPSARTPDCPDRARAAPST